MTFHVVDVKDICLKTMSLHVWLKTILKYHYRLVGIRMRAICCRGTLNQINHLKRVWCALFIDGKLGNTSFIQEELRNTTYWNKLNKTPIHCIHWRELRGNIYYRGASKLTIQETVNTQTVMLAVIFVICRIADNLKRHGAYSDINRMEGKVQVTRETTINTA